jgi:putative membrane protein
LNPTEADAWQRSSPLAILFFLGKIVVGLAKNAPQLIAPVAAFLVAFPGTMQTKVGLAATAFAVLTTVTSLLRYWFFRFQVTDDAVLIREGVINKKQLNITFSRIQGVNSEQSFIYRWFDLVTLSFDTAGSAGSEGELPAVKTDFAAALTERIGRVRREPAEGAEGETAASPPALLVLDWRDMMRIGLADRRAFVFVAVITPFFDQLSEALGESIAKAIGEFAADVTAMGTAIAATVLGTIVLGVVVLLVTASIVAAFLRFHNFRLYLDGDRLRSRGGLLTRHEASMETGKVQVARVSQGLVMRWSSRLGIVLKQASSRMRQDNKSFTIPAAPPGFQTGFLHRVFAPEAPGIDLDFDSAALERVDPRFMRPRILYLGVLPPLVIAAALWREVGAGVAVLVAWLPLWAAVQYKVWRRLAWCVTDDALVRRKGFLGTDLDVFLLRKVQRVTVTQSPYQRRKGLASIRFFLASGSIRIPYLDKVRADALSDYVLYKVESSTRSWH